MAEFGYVQDAQYSPTRCAFCATHEGPFVDTHLEGMTIATATGMVDFQGHIYVCSSKYRPDGERVRTGCVEQMAHLCKTMVHNEDYNHAHQLLAEALQEIEELKATLKGKKIDLSVEELQELLARA